MFEDFILLNPLSLWIYGANAANKMIKTSKPVKYLNNILNNNNK